jgi:hypothetical protein
MPDWRLVIQTDRLNSADLQGRDVTVVIERVVQVEVEDMKDPKKKKTYFDVFFKGKKKPLLFKATNCKSMTKLTGTRITEKWVGVAITLFPTMVNAYGDRVEAIRVRPEKPSAEMIAAAERVAGGPREQGTPSVNKEAPSVNKEAPNGPAGPSQGTATSSPTTSSTSDEDAFAARDKE